MKRRMSAAERVALEDYVRPIVRRYVRNSGELRDELRRGPQVMTRLVVEILERGCEAPAVSGSEGTSAEQWMVNFELAFRQLARDLAPAAPFVVLLRLGRHEKTREAGFQCIVSDLAAIAEREKRTDLAITVEYAEAIYRAGLRRVAKLLYERGVNVGSPASVVSPQRAAQHCDGVFDRRVARDLVAMGRSLQNFAARVNARHASATRSLRHRVISIHDADAAAALYRASAEARGVVVVEQVTADPIRRAV